MINQQDTTEIDSRVAEASKKVYMAPLKQLTESDFFRHDTGIFRQEITGKDNFTCIVIGLGNLQEPLRYTAQWYAQKGNLDGFRLILLDVIEESYFKDLVKKTKTYKPTKGEVASEEFTDLKKAFELDPKSGEYVAKKEIKDFLSKAVETGRYQVNIANSGGMDEIGGVDYLSCQNVFGYVSPLLLDLSMMRVMNLVKVGGVAALRTDSGDTQVGEALERQHVPVKIIDRNKMIFRKVTPENGQDLGFLKEKKLRDNKIADNKRESGNVFGI
ncbi:MAG: hypothetical protein V1858_03625 [Candidatus Gottesmanbacteria bacterium]